ncbi:bacteriophage replication protein O [Oxobacter pfennigii]|uniref:Bacteriophage replication protein O n=1 Tax=Oxobacter pfennigii TaxID=36849 RepID=A0A0P8Y8H0_9CLOT|nr:replication protein [Oxobacter pfennigii]KPU43014.1 bacteriophage replication protein O [Oxobacter pfennigii]
MDYYNFIISIEIEDIKGKVGECMSKPQLEDGYTKIANELLEQIYKLPLNGTQFRIIAVIIRYTYGYSRKEHEMSESFISSNSGIYKRQVQRALKELIESKIITVVKEASFNSSRVIAINKNYAEWCLKKHQVTKKTSDDVIDAQPGDKKDVSPGVQKDTHIKKIYKENNKENNILSTELTPYTEIMDMFNRICTTLPQIKGITGNRKSSTRSRWKEHPDINFFKQLFETVDKSQFLSGRNDKWKGCCFDWIMKPSNLQKIIEGNYDNKSDKVNDVFDFDFKGIRR